jgi:protocatechuate 3,4-dioxygenase beta subunit
MTIDVEAETTADPPLAYPGYRSTARRAPQMPPIPAAPGDAEMTGPVFGDSDMDAAEADLTQQAERPPLGERIIVSGRVVDSDDRPVRRALVEIWQANAAGRYAHERDDHDAPLDPGFTGAGRCLTGDDGTYRFVTVKPGAYPWQNHDNAWRPAHIHFSVFGRSFTQRLVTQMYFPGDPLLTYDPIFQSVPGPGRPRLVSAFDADLTSPGWALGYRWDIVLRGATATPVEV